MSVTQIKGSFNQTWHHSAPEEACDMGCKDLELSLRLLAQADVLKERQVGHREY